MTSTTRTLEDSLIKLLPRTQVERMVDLINRMDATTVEWKNLIPIPEDKMLAFETNMTPICSNTSEMLQHVAIVCTVQHQMNQPILSCLCYISYIS